MIKSCDKILFSLYNRVMEDRKNNRMVVITGATSGIGFETARALTGRGIYVIGIGRSPEKCTEAKQQILEEEKEADSHFQFVIADLSSLKSVSLAAQQIEYSLSKNNVNHIDVLINNAGTVSSRRIETAEGNELQWTVNHLSAFYLTYLLLPLLKKSKDARILTISSDSHRGARIHWKDPNFKKGYNTLRAYKQSKLANVLFTYHLNRVLGSNQSIKACAIDPGLVKTEIGHKNTKGIVSWIWSLRQKNRSAVSPRKGASTSIYLATTDKADLKAGSYWKNCRPIKSSRYSYNRQAAERLWALSEEMCGITYT